MSLARSGDSATVLAGGFGFGERDWTLSILRQAQQQLRDRAFWLFVSCIAGCGEDCPRS